MARLTRRRRLLTYTGTAAVVFIIVTTLVVTRFGGQDDVYRPGEDVEGLTSTLTRELPDDYPRVTFTDVAASAGIVFHHFMGARSSQLPEDMGSGAAWGDFDNDGWQDLYVVGAAGPLTMTVDDLASAPTMPACFATTPTGRSRTSQHWPVSASRAGAWGRSGLTRTMTVGSTSLSPRMDLTSSIATTGTGRLPTGRTLLDSAHHQASRLVPGGATMTATATSISTSSGTYSIPLLRPARCRSTTTSKSQRASIRRLSRRNEISCITTAAMGRSRGSVPAGVANPSGRGLEASWTDFDRDGWPDLYVANDVSDNALFRNLGNGTFADISLAARVADYRGAMGIAVGDWDGDTDMDMLVTHWIAQENALYANKLVESSAREAPGLLQFMDEADRFGLGQVALDFVGWGTAFIDYDNDGRLDAFIANGSTFQKRDDPTSLTPMTDQLFWNRGAAQGFFDMSSVAGTYFRDSHVGRGAAFADWDNDGDVDAYVANNGGPGILLRNDGGNSGNWLGVRLEGRTSNRSALGAKLRAVVGDDQQIREVGCPEFLPQPEFVGAALRLGRLH